MAYKALYRTFRPQRFEELVGQEAVARTLTNAIMENRVAHAYLFSGPRGTGKTSAAKILAKAVNCLAPEDGEPCNRCANCDAINRDRMMDVMEIDAASNRGIDEMRDLKERVQFAPSMGKYKVYIIDEVHMLTTEAFNALLKTLEEPPDHVLFILATTDPQKVPATVLSRTQRFDFYKISAETIANHLSYIAAQEGVEVTPDALALMARRARGGLRDAVSFLDQSIAFADGDVTKEAVQAVIGGLDEKEIGELINLMIANDLPRFYDKMKGLLKKAPDERSVLSAISLWLRDVQLMQIRPPAESLYENDVTALLKEQSQKLSRGTLTKMRHVVRQAQDDMRLAPDRDVVLDLAMMDLIEAIHPTESTVISRQVVEDAPVVTPKAPPKAPQGQEKATEAPASEPAAEKERVVQPENLPALWEQAMKVLKEKSVRLHAFMYPAQPVGFKDGLLVISFPAESGFHHRQMQEGENQRVLNDVLSQVAGQPIKTRLDLVRTAEAAPKEEAYDLVKVAQDVFGADKVVIVDDD